MRLRSYASTLGAPVSHALLHGHFLPSRRRPNNKNNNTDKAMKSNNTQLTHPAGSSGFRSALIGMAMLVAAGSAVFAGNGNLGNPGIIPPQSHAHGTTYAEWAESYWQWVHAGGGATTPQTGPVHFLGTAPYSPVPGATTEQAITVPPGTTFFSIISSFFDNNEGVNPPLTDEELIAEANAIWASAVVSTKCYVDGVEVKGLDDPVNGPYFLQTDIYVNEFADGGPTNEVAVGVFVMIKPLPVGVHTVRIIGVIKPGPTVLTKDVTYTITVKK